MKRKHMPGCYCCQGVPGDCDTLDCCSAEEEFPEISVPNINWTQVSRTVSTDCCCVTEIYNYNDPDPVAQCCESPGSYNYLHEAVRSDYGFQISQALINFQTQCGGDPKCMDFFGVDCCLPQPTKICDTSFEFEHDFQYWFQARIYYSTLEIMYGKQLVQCETDEEPVCRYYVKVNLRGRYEAFITCQQTTRRKREVTYLHPCFEYVGQTDIGKCTDDDGILIADQANICNDPRGIRNSQCDFEKTCVTCVDPYPCDDPDTWPANASGPCSAASNQQDTTPSGCWSQAAPFCVQYIKWFDEQPASGQLTFGDADVYATGDPCPLPLCNIGCPPQGSQNSITIFSGTPDAPWWYDNPPTIETTNATVNVEYSVCMANWRCGDYSNYLAGSITSCCEGGVTAVRSCPPITCSGTSISYSSQQPIDCVEPTDDPDRCRLTAVYQFPSPKCGMQEGIFGDCNPVATLDPLSALSCPSGANPSYFPPCIQSICGTSDPCASSDCCFSWSCECFCSCINRFSLAGIYYATNTYDITVSGGWVEKQCVYDIPDITIELTF